MIYYRTEGLCWLSHLFRFRGGGFRTALLVSVLNAGISCILYESYPNGSMTIWGDQPGILLETQAWAGFSFLVGFMIVFRTSQAYSRFWDGCQASYRMQAEWRDAITTLFAFTKHSQSPPEEVNTFKQLIIRLASMLHAASFAELEASSESDSTTLWAHQYELIDPAGIDTASLRTINECESRADLLMSWILQVITENIELGVLSVPAPLLSRVFQEFASGMVAFHDAMRISHIPFPFLYAQTCDCALVFHWILVPFLTSQWAVSASWAGIFSFVQVFFLWKLNFTATEIDHPFGRDPNDIDGDRMQSDFNNHLILLISIRLDRSPCLSTRFTRSGISTEDILRSSRSSGQDLASRPTTLGSVLAGVSQDMLVSECDTNSPRPSASEHTNSPSPSPKSIRSNGIRSSHNQSSRKCSFAQAFSIIMEETRVNGSEFSSGSYDMPNESSLHDRPLKLPSINELDNAPRFDDSPDETAPQLSSKLVSAPHPSDYSDTISEKYPKSPLTHTLRSIVEVEQAIECQQFENVPNEKVPDVIKPRIKPRTPREAYSISRGCPKI